MKSSGSDSETMEPEGSKEDSVEEEDPGTADNSSNTEQDRSSPVTFEDVIASSNTLFVFYIPPFWEDKDLDSAFEQFGKIESCKVCRKPDSSSRGYGFVKYAEPQAAVEAIAGNNGLEVGENKKLKVQLKLPHAERAQQSWAQQRNAVQGHTASPGCTVFVFHLPNQWGDNELRQQFSHYGLIVQCTVQRDSNQRSKGYGFVSFDKVAGAIKAINGMNGFSVGNKYLKVAMKKGEEHFYHPSPLQAPLLWHPTGSVAPLPAQYQPHRPFSPAGLLHRPQFALPDPTGFFAPPPPPFFPPPFPHLFPPPPPPHRFPCKPQQQCSEANRRKQTVEGRGRSSRWVAGAFGGVPFCGVGSEKMGGGVVSSGGRWNGC